MTLKNFFVGRTIVIIIILLFVGLIAVFKSFNNYIYEEKQGYAANDYKNAEYVFEGERVRLTNGSAVTDVVPASSSKVTTTYLGHEIFFDLNDDGREDVFFLLTQNKGGSGTFYYAVAALNTERGYVGSEAILLGDRITIQNTEKGKYKILIVNYADRALQDNFSTPASINKTIWLLLDPVTMQFGLVEPNFSGESADGVR